MNVQGNAQFMFLCNPKKSGASRAFIPFLQVTQKVLTKNLFHWLEVITEILSFQQIFNVRKKKNIQFFEFSKNLKKIDKKTIFLGYFGPLKANYRLFLQLITLHYFFLTLLFFICIIPYIHICSYYFLILCFYFHLLFLNLPATKHILHFTMFHIISLQTARNITEIRNDERKSVHALILSW